jgi:hypothetical protein
MTAQTDDQIGEDLIKEILRERAALEKSIRYSQAVIGRSQWLLKRLDGLLGRGARE